MVECHISPFLFERIKGLFATKSPSHRSQKFRKQKLIINTLTLVEFGDLVAFLWIRRYFCGENAFYE